jgi:spore germination protein
VISSKNEVKFAGAAVIKGKTNKLIGFFNEEELEGLTWITGKGKGGLVKSYNKKTGQVMTYEIKSMKSLIESHIKGNEISFNVKIESKGRLIENWDVPEKPDNNAYLKQIEEAAEQVVKRRVGNVLEKCSRTTRSMLLDLVMS